MKSRNLHLQHLIDKRGLCSVCGKESYDWCGYVKSNEYNEWGHFCGTCKKVWVAWAMTKGVKFGPHAIDGYSAHVLNKTDDEIVELWKTFIAKKIVKHGLKEKVVFT